MEIIILSVLSVFAVLGICCFIKDRIRCSFMKSSSVVFYEYHNENDIEYDLRCIRTNYPDCKICLINHGGNPEFLNMISKSIKNIEIIN